MPEEKTEFSMDFIIRCQSDFVFFCEQVLKLEMTDYHKEVAKLPLKHRFLCLLLPRGHSKTTLFNRAYPIWRMIRENNIEICMVFSAMEQSMGFLKKIQELFIDTPFLQRYLPQDRSETWNTRQINLNNRSKLYIRAFNPSIRGVHPNYFICDDILRDMDTPMETIKETFWGAIFQAGQMSGCKYLVVGTPLSIDDLYADLEKDKSWKFIRKSAVIEDEAGRWVKPLCERKPGSFFGTTLGELKRQRESMGEWRFERELMCRPRATGDALFPQEMILNCFDYDLDFGYSSDGATYIGTDFAMSTTKSGDYNVFTVVESLPGKTHTKKTDKGKLDIDNPVIVRHITRFRGGTGQVESIRTLSKNFASTKINADMSGVGAKFIQELREAGIPVYAQSFQPEQRNLLLLGLRRILEQGRLVIPAKGMSKILSDRLAKEMSAFRMKKLPSGRESWHSTIDHDDMPISLAMAVKDVSTPRKVMQDVFFGV